MQLIEPKAAFGLISAHVVRLGHEGMTVVGVADSAPVPQVRAEPAGVAGDGAPRFSVLCSAYNCEQYLAGTIDSVIAQTDPDWELIVVDNGMSDEVAAIVQRYTHDPRVRLLRQRGAGLIDGIATAAAASTGQHIVPLDSDDQLLPDFCRRMAEVLEQRPEIDVLSCDALIFPDDGPDLNQVRSFLRHRTGLDHPLTVIDLIGRRDSIPYFAAFRRKAWIAAGGYAPGTRMVEDIALFLRLINSGHDVRVLPESLVRYRFREDSASRDPETVEEFDRLREQISDAAARASNDPATKAAWHVRRRELHYLAALRRARFAFVDGELGTARAAALDAFRTRSNARSTVVLIGVWTAPRLLRVLRPIKNRATRWVARLAARLLAQRDRLRSR